MKIPDTIPMVDQDLVLYRCLSCGELFPGMFGITRAGNQPAIDHLFDVHRDDLLAGRSTPRFVNCAIQDPFWFDEHARSDSGLPVDGEERTSD